MEITKDMSIMEIVVKHPEAARVMMELGLGCIGCAAAQFETLAEGAEVHGIDADMMVQAINDAITLSA